MTNDVPFNVDRIITNEKLSSFCEKYEMHLVDDALETGNYRRWHEKKEHDILASLSCKTVRLIWIIGFRMRYSTSVELHRAMSKFVLMILFRSSSSS